MRDVTLAGIAMATHGPLDMWITLNHWHLETNPLVLELGLPVWLALKTILCLGVVVSVVLTKESDSGTVTACLWFLAGLGVLVVLSNGAVLLS